MKNNVTPEFLSKMRIGMAECFSLGELQNLCIDLGVDYEDLSGEGKESKARELISYLHRRDRLAKLVSYCVAARPDYEWPSTSTSTDSPKVTILLLTADPTNLARLRLGEELREIQEKLQLAKLRDRFDLNQRMSIRPADISQALLDLQPQIVHFAGHGTGAGALIFENQKGEAYLIEPEALSDLFEQFSSQVHCVVLNACYSEIQAKGIARHIEYVIGMNQAIGDRASIAFSIGFYQALGAGRTIEDAHKLGCVQIRLQNIPEHLAPVLIKKPSGK